MFWNIIFHTLNAEKTKTKEKGLKSYSKNCSTLNVFLHIHVHVLLSFKYLRHNIMDFTNKSLQKKNDLIYMFLQSKLFRELN